MHPEFRRLFHIEQDIVHSSENEDFDRAEMERLLAKFSLEHETLAKKLEEEHGANKPIDERLKNLSENFAFYEARSLEIQKEKDAVMHRMEERLHEIDEPVRGIESAGRETLFYTNGQYFVEGSDGTRKVVSGGDVIADMSWGARYIFDASVPRGMEKKCIVEEAKLQLHDLLNRQLANLNAGMGGRLRADKRLDSLINNENLEDLDKEETELSGFISERMAYTLLLRKSYDENSGYRIERADAEQDEREKVDMIIRRHPYDTGEDNAGEKILNRVGIQFSISHKNAGKSGHRKSMEEARKYSSAELDDVAYVAVAGEWGVAAFKRWLEEGKPSGGPEQFLTEEVKRNIYIKSLQTLYPPEQVEAGWNGKIDDK